MGERHLALAASRLTILAYLCVVAALAPRVAMAYWPEATVPLMHGAATLWGAGFAAFLIAYSPMLLRRPGPH